MNPPARAFPRVTPDDEAFWRAGAEGVLRFQWCGDCERFQHPPAPVCHRCLGRSLSFEPVSGRGLIHTFTVNHQPWTERLSSPYAIVVVSIDEDPELRMITRLVDGTAVDDVRIGAPVQVVFEEVEGTYLPLFERCDG